MADSNNAASLSLSATKLLVSSSLGLAFTISLSAKSALANDHVSIIDNSAHTNIVGDHHTPLNFVDSTHVVHTDNSAHFNNMQSNHPQLPLDAGTHFNSAPEHCPTIDHGSHFNFADTTHTFHNMDSTVHLNVAPHNTSVSDGGTHNWSGDHGHSSTNDIAEHSGQANEHAHVYDHAGTFHHNVNGDVGHSGSTHPANLDLGSTHANFLAGNLANFHTITIDVGGTKETVDLHTRLTAAEYVAAEQVLTGGTQTLTLSSTGAAVGGQVVLDTTLLSSLHNSIGTLTITHGVQLIDEVNYFTLSGNLNNSGTILMASSVAGQTDTISAANIVNGFEGMIGSYTGATLAGLFSADPVLNAMTSFSNFGTISSVGNLAINAPVINNISDSGHTASITAAHSVDLNAASLVNSGHISALAGDINALSSSNLAVTNNGGTLLASGNINLASNNESLKVIGGTFDSQALNLKAGHSTVNLQAENVSGVVNASGDNVHLYTSVSDLKLGNIDSYGDPTLASQGNIIIDGTIAPTGGANLAIVSGANILSGTGGQLDTRNLSVGGGNGGNLSLVAGANFTVDGSGNVVLTDSANPGKGSATGGLIDLSGIFGGTGPVTSITTAGTGATGNAGYIEMVAYRGTGLNSGIIATPNSVTLDAGSAGGLRGDVKVIASGQGAPYSMGGITGNNITVANFTPTVGSGMFFDGTGTASNGISSFSTSGSLLNGIARINGNISGTGDISLSSGGLFVTGNISANGSGGQANGATLDGGSGHIISLTAAQAMSIQGSISAVGGGGAGSGSATSGRNGGAGGSGGQVIFTTTGQPLNNSVTGNINVSGGGGGGGAGGSESVAATQGGAGGLAGTVKFNSSGFFGVTGTILAYDGGAGGNGGSSLLGVGAGGGGGSAYGGAGGGGGGGTGNNAGDFAAGGGGGFSLASGSGGGGGGVYGSAGVGTLSFGGNGGSGTGNGIGGAGDVSGLTGVGSNGGAGGGIVGTAPGGAGGTATGAGGSGGQTAVVGQGAGQAGAGARVVTGHGLVDVKVSSANLRIESGALKVNALGFNGSGGGATIVDSAGVPLNLLGVGTGVSGNFSLTTTQNAGTTGADGTVNILGAIASQTTNITTNGDAGPNNINILAPIVSGPQFTIANLISNGGSITTSGTGSINTVTGSVKATGDVNIATNVGAPFFGGPAFSVTSTNGNVTINQGTSPISFSGSSGLAGGSFTVNSHGALSAGNITSNGGTISLNTIGGNLGININGPVSTGNTAGSVTITPSGTGAITEQAGLPGAIITSNSINLLTNSSIGTASAPILTNAVNSGTINAVSSTTGNVYLSDRSTGVVTVNAPTTSTGTLSIAAQASLLNVPQANYSNVSIVDNGPIGNVLLNSGNSATAVLGNGSGSFLVSATGNIDANANNGGIVGTSASLTSTNGSIGSARRLTVTAPTLTARAANGSVDVATPNATTVNGAGGTSFNLIDTVSGSPVAINGPIAANNVNIQAGGATNLSVNGSLGNASASQVNVTSGGGIAFSAGSGVSASNINLNAANNTITFGSTATATGLNLSTNVGVVSVNAAAPGGTDTINAGGDLAFNGTFNSSNAVQSTVGGALTVGSAANHSAGITGQSLSIAAQSLNNYGTLFGANLTVNTSAANGSITNSGSISGSGMQLLAGNGSINNNAGGAITSSSSLSFQGSTINNQGTASAQTQLAFANPNGSLAISGAPGSFTTASGANLSFQALGAVTIDGSAGNPISTANPLGNFSVAAGGNFTSPLNGVTLVPDSSGNGGAINISAADVVYNGTATRTTPFVLSANGGTNPGNRGGLVNLNLFGSAASGITVGNAVGNFSISATGSDGGQVSIATPGNLTVNTAQMTANATSSTGNGSAITLSSGNNLLVNGNLDTHNGTGSYGAISLTSGSAQPFLIDGTQAATTNGQTGISNGQGISGSTVTYNGPGGMSVARNYVLSGPGAITINGAGLINNGNVNTSVLSIVAPGNGFLTTGATGTYSNLPMQALSLSSSSGNFTITGSTPSANQVNISALNGAVGFGAGTAAITAAADGSGNGGTININAQTLSTGSTALNASGTTGSGGTVAINLTGNNSVNVDNSHLQINVANAAGQAGGNLVLANGGNVNVDAKYLNLGSNFAPGQGANLSLTSGSKLNLDHTNKLPVGLHNLNLTSNSSSAFTLGDASSSGNGIRDEDLVLAADNVAITNNGGGISRGENTSVNGSTVALTALGNIGQANQPIVVGTPSLNVNSTGGSAYVSLINTANTDFLASVAGTLSLASTGSVSTSSPVNASTLLLNVSDVGDFNPITTNASYVSAIAQNGSVFVNDTQYSPITVGVLSGAGNVGIVSNGDINTTQAIVAGSGATVISNFGSIQVGSASGVSAHSVDIMASAGAITFAVPGTSINATSAGFGRGGDISLTAGAINSNGLTLNASGTSDGVSGGSVSIRQTGANPLQVGSGAMTINVANASGQNGGSVNITTSGSINVDAKYLNLGGNFPANGGANLFLFANSGIYLSNTNRLPTGLSSISLNSGGSDFTLGGAAAGTSGIADNHLTLSADTVTISSMDSNLVRGTNSSIKGAEVVLSAFRDVAQAAQPIVVNTALLDVRSFTGSAYVNLRTAPITELFSEVPGTLVVNSTGTITPGRLVDAGTLILSANAFTAGTPINTVASSLSVTANSGSFSIVDVNGGQTTIGALRAPGTVQVENFGDLITSQPIHSVTDLKLTSDYGSVIIGNGLSASNSITLSTQGNSYGGIVDSAVGTDSAVSRTVNLATGGGSIGTSDNPFRTTASNLNIDTAGAGLVYVANTNSGSNGTVQLGQANVANFNLVDTNSTAANRGTLVISGIQSNYGDIVISSNERTMKVGPSVALNTTNGNIILQNTFASRGANQPSIQVGDNASIHGSSYGDPSTGNVYLALGAVPAATDVLPGVAPTGGSPQINGTVYFGTTANPNGSITTSTGDVLTGSERILSFTTNGLPSSQITLGQNVTIIADPPVPAGAAAPVLPTLQYGAGTSGVATVQPVSMPLSAMYGTTLPTTTSASGEMSVSTVKAPGVVDNLAALSASVADALAGSTTGGLMTGPLGNAGSRVAAINASLSSDTTYSSSALSTSAAIRVATSAAPNTAPKSSVLTGSVSNIGRRNFEKGAMLLAPEQNTVIETPHGSLAVTAGSVALLVSSENGLAVYDLHDSRKESVVLSFGSQRIALSPGRSVVLTGSGKEFEEVNPVRFVGYRRLSSRAITNETRLYHAEFELLSMVRGLRPISSLISSDNPKARKTMGNLLKTAAIMLELGQGGEQFKYYLPKELMAYAASKSH